MPVRLFVGNFPYNVTEAELREHFSAVGPLSLVYLPTDRDSGRPRGFAFVEFSGRAQAEEAVRRFNNQLFKGRPLVVNVARAKEDRPHTNPGSHQSRPASRLPSEPQVAATPAPGDGGSRSFGAEPVRRRNRGKGKRSSESERGTKGPIRELVRGRFFGADDDEPDDDELIGENFASRLTESDGRDHD